MINQAASPGKSNNFLEFQAYKSHCPLCGSKLATHFHRQLADRTRPGEVDIDGDYLVIHDKFRTYALGAGNTYSVEYRINTSTNSFSIERLKNNQLQDQISIPILAEIARHCRVNSLWLSRRCDVCLRYRYASNYFNFKLAAAVIHPFYVSAESVFLSKPRDEDVMAYIITQKPTLNKIDLEFGPIATHLLEKTNLIQMPLEKRLEFPWMELDFSNPFALVKKLDTLIFFS